MNDRRIAWYRGVVWYIDHVQWHESNRISLIDLKDSSSGVNALKSDVREIVGEEYERQIAAIQYFRRLGVCH